MPPAKLKRGLNNTVTRQPEPAVAQESGALGAEKRAQ
jgi:hypothetical protein